MSMNQVCERRRRAVIIIGIGEENSIGYRIAQRFKQAGDLVIGVDIKEPKKPFDLGNFVICDVTDEESVQEAFKHWNHADVIVNCAGINRMGALREYSLKDWDDTIRVNLTSNFLLLREWVRTHSNGAQKTYIAITSDTGFIPKSNSCAYAASKAGANMFVQATARELNKRYGQEWVVTALALGRVEGTPMDRRTISDMVAQMGVTPEEADTMLNKNIPFGRGAGPWEVAQWVYFLVEHGQFASGNVLRIDGGQLQG